MAIPPFDPNSHTGRNHPETSFEAAESLVDGGAQEGIMKMLQGWYDLALAGGNYMEATDAAARHWPDWDRDKASPRSTDCKQLHYVDPVLDTSQGTSLQDCTCKFGPHPGRHIKRDKAFVWRINREGCAELGKPYLFGLPPPGPEPEPTPTPPDDPTPPPPSWRRADGSIDFDAVRKQH